MFENLQVKLDSIFKKLRSRGKLSEKDVSETLREIRVALLEADVNLNVVRNFIQKVKEKATDSKLSESLTPGQLVIKFVKDELIELMGGENTQINISGEPPFIIMIVGLHGSGKTTTIGKLALYFKEKGHKPLLVAADIHRPAASQQLQVLSKKINVPVFTLPQSKNALEICKSAVNESNKTMTDIILIDTAGRLHIDTELMQELNQIKKSISPHEILLIVDAMTGQEAVNIAEKFDQLLNIDGIILTKLDGDARGGAALSVKAVTGKPIKFVGVGEKLEALEPFYPDRMAHRILGMGDILTLIEKAESVVDLEKTKILEKKIKSQEFDLEDFLEQMQQVRKIGPLDQILSMLPGFSQSKQLQNIQIDEKSLKHTEAIIYSMTPEERKNPAILNASRRKRIASGSGVHVSKVNQLLKQFEMSKKMMKQMTDKKGLLNLPFLR